MKKKWQMKSPDKQSVQSLIKSLKCHPVTATVLVNRSIHSRQAALQFLTPSLNHLRSPFSLKDMDRAVDRLLSAIANHERILIFGDYDADGITATSILFEFLRYAGADVSFHIPHRIKEGYGLKVNHISEVALANTIDLIITVDCGSSSHKAVEAANKVGMDIIITDHHKISEEIPPAVAVVNPQRHDCNAGLEHLAGVGVVFYFLICLRKRLRDIHFWKNKPEPNLKRYCDLVAIGTVADIVPIVDENRILTRAGLDIMRSGHRIGLTALATESGMKNGYADTDDIAFRLAPRLNASGRMDHAKSAVDLLTTDQLKTAAQISRTLNQLNGQRQLIEKKTFEEIMTHLRRNPHLLQQKSLVLFCKNWHEGILGIVAARLVRQYFRPVVLIMEQNGLGKGSGRSIPGFDLYDGLLQCAELLESFGGHAMAGGLTLKPETIPDFQKSFENVVQHMTDADDFIPSVSIDSEIRFNLITDKLMNELEGLKPFGNGNAEPLFLAKHVKAVQSGIVGETHRRMVLRQYSDNTNKSLNAIQFNIDPEIPQKNDFEHIVFRLRWNRWNGNKTAQIVIEDT